MGRVAVVVVLALAACVEDAGMLDYACGPYVLPVGVENVGTSESAIDEAVAMWNDAAAPEVLFDRIEPGDRAVGWAAVAEGQTPLGVSGTAGVYAPDGPVLTCDVVVSSDHAYHRETLVMTIAHELGHCLGLADDPPSLDLGSIMSDPFYSGARPTAHDVDLVLRGCDGP